MVASAYLASSCSSCAFSCPEQQAGCLSLLSQCPLTLYEATVGIVGSEEFRRMVRHLTTGMDGSKTWLPWVHQPTSGMDGSWCASRQLECVVGMDGYLGMLFTTKS